MYRSPFGGGELNKYKQSNDYDLGLINGMIIPYVGFDFLTGVYHIIVEKSTLQENTVYYVVDTTIGLKFTGYLFLLAAILYIFLWIGKKDKYLIYLFIGGALNIFLHLFYAWVVINVDQGMSAGGWRYVLNGVINLAIMIGGFLTWRKIDRETNPRKITRIM
jgi:hypothetical protein